MLNCQSVNKVLMIYSCHIREYIKKNKKTVNPEPTDAVAKYSRKRLALGPGLPYHPLNLYVYQSKNISIILTLITTRYNIF